MVVLPDADMDLAADSAVSAAYGSAGERCMAISVLVAVGDAADALLPKIRERIAQAQGRARAPSPGAEMGPLVTKEHRAKVAVVRRARARPRARGSSWTAARSTCPVTRAASSSARACSTTSRRR